jgi:hydroxymethylbilane synthase
MSSQPVFTPGNPLRIGTRRSPLALAQAEMVAAAIRIASGLDDASVILVPMLASGDKVQDRPLAEIGGKALWTKELERALVDNDVDLAVHSMKDVETVRPDIFQIAAMLPRADVRDRLVGAPSIAALTQGAKVGTSSPRRAAQMLMLRPDLNIVQFRGNVNTRLAQIEAGVADATLLAAAGLDRLEMSGIGAAIGTSEMLPAASQGAIGIDILATRQDLAAMLGAINDMPTFAAVMAERAFLESISGTCHSPVAALAVIEGDNIHLRAEILREDGSERQLGEIRFALGDHGAPARLATTLLAGASPELRALFQP